MIPISEIRKKVTREETIKKLEDLGVQFAEEDSPFGKIENASMMGGYRPIYIKVKKGFFYRIVSLIRNVFGGKIVHKQKTSKKRGLR